MNKSKTDIENKSKESADIGSKDNKNKNNTKSNKKVHGKKKKSTLFKFLIAVGIVAVIILGVAIAYIVHLYNLMNYDDGTEPSSSIPQEQVSYEEVENPEDIAHLPIVTIQTSEHDAVVKEKEGRRVEGVYNILLLGLDKAQGNLSDTIMIATLDTRDNSIKLTSIMRDILVQIPGYAPNKLNVPYKLGGISLLYQVLENYFEIKFDGYVAINYYALEDAVNALGGVSLYISDVEADFLNTSNYISDEASRNLVGGKTQKVNGSQFVGYCRQRSTTVDADFDATDREVVKLFEKGVDGTAESATVGSIDYRTKYPTSEAMVKSIISNYTKIKGESFEPKQKTMSFFYCPSLGAVIFADTDSTVAELNAQFKNGIDAKGNALTDSTVWINLTTDTANDQVSAS